MDKEKGQIGKPFLNIIDGTSIGAINAAIIVSYVVENDTWEGSAERLNDFWKYLSKESSFDQMPGFTAWWETAFTVESPLGKLQELFSKGIAITGIPTVFTPLIPIIDTRFFDHQNIWYRFDSGPLKRSLERFAKFPIAPTFDDKSLLPQPRLVTVS